MTSDLAHATYCGEVTMVDFWVGRLLAKLDVLGLRENTLVFFTSDHGFYFGEHDYFGKAEWINDQDAAVTEGSVVPDWLPESWLLTVGWSPLYKELTNVPLMVRAPGLEPGRRPALTTAPDLAPTILDLVDIERPGTMQGESFGDVLAGEKDEHRPFVVSSWPLYFAAGEFTTAVDSRSRRIASYMPMTVTTRGAIPHPRRSRLHARVLRSWAGSWRTVERVGIPHPGGRGAGRAGALVPGAGGYSGALPGPPPPRSAEVRAGLGPPRHCSTPRRTRCTTRTRRPYERRSRNRAHRRGPDPHGARGRSHRQAGRDRGGVGREASVARNRRGRGRGRPRREGPRSPYGRLRLRRGQAEPRRGTHRTDERGLQGGGLRRAGGPRRRQFDGHGQGGGSRDRQRRVHSRLRVR